MKHIQRTLAVVASAASLCAVTASPVLSGGHLYFTGEEGGVKVISAAKEFKLLATNHLGSQSMATPAVHNGAIFFRTRKGLIAVGEKAVAGK